jgi:uncharacterized protein
MCVVCRERFDKRQLTRVVRTAEGVQVDHSGKLHGRGAYVCDKAACWEHVVPALDRALQVTLTDADRERLRQAQPVPS